MAVRPTTDYDAPFKCRAEALQEGEWLSGNIYYQIQRAVGTSHSVKDSFGRELSVSDQVLADEMISAAQFDATLAVSRTEMVEKLVAAGACVFTIRFRKQLTGADLSAALEQEDDYGSQPAAKRVKVCTQALKAGEMRTLTGYLRNTEHTMGRSNVIDLDVDPSQHRERQVDHRTVEELILKRVKYVLKG